MPHLYHTFTGCKANTPWGGNDAGHRLLTKYSNRGVGHTTDDQQAWCRDFYALREWAHDPVRAVRWMNTAPAHEPDHYVELDRDT